MLENDTFQHYRVLRRTDGSLWELGRGAMGVTFKALDTSLERTVALKIIRADALHHDRARQRFVREARAAAGLNHPNIARVFHLGESVQSYFYAMEFVDGETLESRVRREGPLSARDALDIAWQVANALRAAGKEGLVHRDIKPSNVMLVREEDHEHGVHVKLIDFGLAKAAQSAAEEEANRQATVTVGGFVGTPHYASPEQLDEKTVDARSDFYSLGVTLWYMLAGQPPFGGSVVQIMSQHLSRLPPFEKLLQVPETVKRLLKTLLQKDPASRPQDAGELRAMIESALLTCGGEQSTPGPTPGARAVGNSRPSEYLAKAGRAVPLQQEPVPKNNGWRKLVVLCLLCLGFVVIAGTVALAAWYLLGPDDSLSPSTKRKPSTPPPIPAPPRLFGTVSGVRAGIYGTVSWPVYTFRS